MTEITKTEEVKEEKIDKKTQEKAVKWFLIILAVLFIAFLLFITYYTTTKQSEIAFDYNGFSFEKDKVFGYQLKLYINQADYPAIIQVRNKPQDLEDIPIDDIAFLAEAKQIYVTLDPAKNLTGKTTIAALEIDAILDNPYLYEIPVNSSFTQEYGNTTIKTCEDATTEEVIIELMLSEETTVTVVEKCIQIKGKTEEDIIRGADRLILTLLGVML